MYQIVKQSQQWCVEDSNGNVSQCFDTRTAAAKHRDALMVADVRKSSNEFAELFDTEGDEHPGVMIAAFPSSDIATAIAAMDGVTEEKDDLHVTLADVGKVDEMTDAQIAGVIFAAERVANSYRPIVGRLGGIGRFSASDSGSGKDVIYAVVDVPGLDKVRSDLVDHLRWNNCDFPQGHGFNPHMTLAYVDTDEDTPMQRLDPISFAIDNISVCVAGKRVDFPLQYNQDLAVVAASEGPLRLFNEYEFAEPPEWMPCLPKPGSFQHPSYGEISISSSRNQRFVSNFQNGVYQEKLPVDAEHQTKLSGACGWITDMRLNEDGSADAKVEWTDRGKTLIESDRFKYVSPEWYDQWTQPDTDEEFEDIVIGAALTTRPFFKESALRPLVASERGLHISDVVPTNETTTIFFEQLSMSQPSSSDVHEDTLMKKKDEQYMEKEKDIEAMEDDAEEDEDESKSTSEPKQPRSFKEAKARMVAAEEKAAEAEQRVNQFAEALDKATARIAAMETEARRKRFAEISSGWLGKPEENIAVLEKFAEVCGEDSDDFKRYVTQQNSVATQMRESNLFNEIGSDASDTVGKSAGERIEIEAKKIQDANPEMSFSDAIVKAAEQNPQMYSEYQQEMRTR